MTDEQPQPRVERYTTTLCCLAQYDPDLGGCQTCDEMRPAYERVDPDGAVTILLEYACLHVTEAKA
ncbi:MAG TPA: hypothetical protein VIY27_11200 [Myxococcota bacterium]